MKKLIVLILILSAGPISQAQLSVGAALGSFRVRGLSDRVKGFGPNLRVEYVGENETQQFYLDAAIYNAKVNDGSTTTIVDELGSLVGYAKTTQAYHIQYIQLGFKRALAGDFTDTKFNFFLGAGGAMAFEQVFYKYELTGYKLPDDKITQILFGFHFNAGMQWRIKPFVLELRGNFDMMTKPIEIAGGENHSYFLTSTRIGIVYPLTKY